MNNAEYYVDPSSDMQSDSPADALGAQLRGEFDESARLRKPYEDEWVKSLRQYKGRYDPGIDIDPKRSKIFLRLTKIKCDAIKSRLMDLLFPANGLRNWDMQPTPDAKVFEATLQNAQAMLVESGKDPNTIDMEKLEQEVALAACEAMTTAIEDQLVALPGRMSYRQCLDHMAGQAVRYGTGVFKGPLVEERTRKAYKPNPQTGKWEMQDVSDGLWPYYEWVPIWQIFPDMSAIDKSQLRYVWQEHLMTAKDLQGLLSQQYFNGDKIKAYIVAHKDGDAQPRDYETEIRSLSEDGSATLDLKGRFRVLERWGYLTGHELADAGVDIAEEQMGQVFSSNLWLLGDNVIKAVLNPLDGIDLPYYFFYYHKDESSFFGEGVPSAMRDCQHGVNASARLLIDNAAIASGPQIGINTRALAEGEDPTAVFPWKVWMFRSSEDLQQAMHVWDLPMHTADLLNLLQMFQNFTDEVTTPRYMHGDEKVSGAGSTMGGLSMLMGAASIPLKDMVKQFDDNVTSPFITAMYRWNMQWSENEALKGDYDVKAMGSTSLIAKEVRAQQYQTVFGVTADPRFVGRVKDDELLEAYFRDVDMPTHLIRTPQEFQQYQQEQMMMQAKAQTDAMVQSLMEQAVAQGIDAKTAFSSIVSKLGGAQPPQQQAGGQPQ